MIILSMTFLTGCFYDKEELVYPTTNTCDTTAVKYSTDIVSILQNNCYSCHAGSAALGGGNRLENYTNLVIYINNGRLLNSIMHSPGAIPMPEGNPKLSDCNIAKIRTWARNGAPNN